MNQQKQPLDIQSGDDEYTVKHVAQIFAVTKDAAEELRKKVSNAARQYAEHIEVKIVSTDAQVKVGDHDLQGVVLLYTNSEEYAGWNIHQYIQANLQEKYFILFSNPNIPDFELLEGLETSDTYVTMIGTDYYNRSQNEVPQYYSPLRQTFKDLVPGRTRATNRFEDTVWYDSIRASRGLLIVRLANNEVPTINANIANMMKYSLKEAVRIAYIAKAQ